MTIINAVRHTIPESKLGIKLCAFFNSSLYHVLFAIIILVGYIFGLEAISFTLLCFITIVCLLVSEDTKPLITFYLFFMMAFSTKNKELFNPSIENSQYAFTFQPIYCLVLAAISIAAFFARFFIYQSYKKWRIFKGSTFLIVGLIVLFGGQMLSGAFSKYFSSYNLIFNLFFFAMILCGFLLVGLTSFTDKTDPMKYFVQIALVFEAIMVVEIAHIYLTTENLIGEDGAINKWLISNGWGIQNNFGGFLCMLLPLNFFAAKKYKYGFFYFIAAMISCVAVVSTLARTSMLFAAIVALIGMVYLIVPTDKKWNIPNIIVIAVSLAVVSILAIVFRDKIKILLDKIFALGSDLNGRQDLWDYGFSILDEFPLFGTGFFSLDPHIIPDISLGYFVPKWFYHNFAVQYLVSTGFFGFACFVVFLALFSIQTFRKPTSRKTVLYLTFVTLLFLSAFDVFLFMPHFIRFYGVVFGLFAIESNREVPQPVKKVTV